MLSQTLKVGENKVPLFFCFVARFPRYTHFVEKHVPGTKPQNDHNSAQKAYHTKIRTLCLLKLLKLEKIKHLYFFVFWPGFRDMAILMKSMSLGQNHKVAITPLKKHIIQK